MREVKAIIRPQRLEQVMEALRRIPGLPYRNSMRMRVLSSRTVRRRAKTWKPILSNSSLW